MKIRCVDWHSLKWPVGVEVLKSDNTGQAVVEFSLVALLLFTLLFAIIEFSHFFYSEMSLQYALREAGRYAVTGQGITSDPNARLAAIQSKFCDNLIGTGLSCATISTDLVVGCPTPAGCSQPGGGPGQTVVLTATFTKPWFTVLFNGVMGGPFTFTLTTTWKNEPSFNS